MLCRLNRIGPFAVVLAFAVATCGAQPASTQPSEHEKIERLIRSIEQLKDAKFIRNGREHTSAEAGEHLRRKWNSAKDKIATAAQFIEKAATKSDRSGEPYQIKFADGKTVECAAFLREQLEKIEKGS